MKERVGKSDIVITTALIPNRPAPMLIPKSMVETMAPGSVIMDLAAQSGGNCELSKPGETVVVDGVSICLLYTSPSPRDRQKSRMPSSA